MTTIRTAYVTTRDATLERVAQYMPSNYSATQDEQGVIWITGEDKAGWTLDDYVLPRLASGLIFATKADSGLSYPSLCFLADALGSFCEDEGIALDEDALDDLAHIVDRAITYARARTELAR